MSSPPMTALAQMSTEGELVLRLVETKYKPVQYTVTVYKEVAKTVNGVTVKEKVPFAETVTKQVMVPVRWRKVPLKWGNPVTAHDIKGERVTKEKAASMLAKEVAVLVANDPVDPFQLQTVKENTLVLVVPMHLLAEPSSFPAFPFPSNDPPTIPPPVRGGSPAPSPGR